MIQFDLKMENIPFLVEERDENIDKIFRLKESLSAWKKTYRKSAFYNCSEKAKQVKLTDKQNIIESTNNKISDLVIRNMKIDDLLWKKHLLLNQS